MIFNILRWSVIRTYLRVVHGLTVIGRENLPEEAPFILVANHAGPLDVLALSAPFPHRLRDRIFPIPAGDPEELRRRLVEEPCVYVLFPEEHGIGSLVASTLVPVVPCHLKGPRKLTLTVGAPLRFPTVANDKDGWTEIAGKIEAEVRRLGGQNQTV